MLQLKRIPLVVSYIRFSMGRQTEGDSLRRQNKIGDELAAKHGLAINSNLRDLGISAFRGRHAKKGALAEFLRLVRDGDVPAGSTLIVESLDRLSRQNLLDAQNQFNAIVGAGVRIITPQFVFEKSENQQVMLQNMMLALMLMATAHDESKKKSDRSSANWRQKQASGKVVTAMLPRWLEVKNGKIVTIPKRVAAVRKIFDRAAQGWGIWRLLKYANTEFRDMTRDGWSRQTMQRLVTNRALIGEYQPMAQRFIDGKRMREAVGEPSKNYFPKVVDEKTFYAVQAAMANRRRTGGPAGGHVNLFAGLLYYVDGSRVYMSNNGRGHRYTPASVLERKVDGPKIMFPVSAFETALLLRLADPELFTLPDQNRKDYQVEKDALEGEITAIKDRAKRISGRMLDSDKEIDSVLELLRDLDARRNALETKLDELRRHEATAPNRATLADMLRLIDGANLSKLTEDERLNLRAAIARVVARIDCYWEKAGWADYSCGTMVTLVSGHQFDFTFQALHVDRTARNAKGHCVKSEASDGVPQYEVSIAPWG